MPKKVGQFKPVALNLSKHPRDLADNEAYDIRNMRLTLNGEITTRPGKRFLSAPRLPDFDSEGRRLLRPNSSIRYAQLFTSDENYLDIFAIDNKVFLYDQDTNLMTLLYEAPGEEPLDMKAYLGYIVITSRDSNSVILQRYQRDVFLLDKNTKIVKSVGEISGENIDFEEAQRVEETNIKDIDIDEAGVYGVVQTSQGAVVLTVTPDSHAGSAITTGGIALDTASSFAHNYPGQMLIQVGYDRDEQVVITSALTGDEYPPTIQISASNPSVSSENVSDMTNGLYEQQAKALYFQRVKPRKEWNSPDRWWRSDANGIYNAGGRIQNGSNIELPVSQGKVRIGNNDYDMYRYGAPGSDAAFDHWRDIDVDYTIGLFKKTRRSASARPNRRQNYIDEHKDETGVDITTEGGWAGRQLWYARSLTVRLWSFNPNVGAEQYEEVTIEDVVFFVVRSLNEDDYITGFFQGAINDPDPGSRLIQVYYAGNDPGSKTPGGLNIFPPNRPVYYDTLAKVSTSKSPIPCQLAGTNDFGEQEFISVFLDVRNLASKAIRIGVFDGARALYQTLSGNSLTSYRDAAFFGYEDISDGTDGTTLKYQNLYRVELDPAGASNKFPQNDENFSENNPVVEVREQLVPGGTQYEYDLTINPPDTAPVIYDPNKTSIQNHYAAWKRDFDGETDSDGFITTEVFFENYRNIISPFKLWYKRRSELYGESGKIFFKDDFPYPHTYNNVQVEETQFTPIHINFDFDIAWVNAASIGDYAGTGLTEDYIIDFPATDRMLLRVKRYARDNLQINDTVVDYYSNETTPGTNIVLVAKNTYFLVYVSDSIGQYVFAIKRTFEGEEIIGFTDLPSGTYGTGQSFKSFTAINGVGYSMLKTDSGLYILRHALGTGTVTVVDRFDSTTYTASALYSAVNDFAILKAPNSNDVYCVTNDTGATAEPVFRLRVVIGTTGEIEFEREAGEVKVYRDIPLGETNYYATGNTANYSKIAFIVDDDNATKLILDDNGGSVQLNNALEWQENLGVPSFDAIYSSPTLGYTKQVRPINTPGKVIATPTNAGTNSLAGTYVYMIVAREVDDATGEIYYESYPSEYSNQILVSGANDTIQIEPFTADYISKNDKSILGDLRVDFVIYRAKVVGSDKFIRLTDFYEIQTVSELTPTTGNTGWNFSTFDDTNADDPNAYPKYRGYSNFYPRCKYVAVYNNVVYLANDRVYQNAIYFSDLFDPTAYNPQAVIGAGEFTNDEITGMIANDGLYIFTRDETHLLTGVGTNIVKTLLSNEIGCITDRSLQLVSGNIMMLSEKGFYALRGHGLKKIDAAIADLTNKFSQQSRIETFYDNNNLEYRVIYDKNKVLVYNAPSGLWVIFEYPYDNILTGLVRENPESDISENIIIAQNKVDPLLALDEANSAYRLLVEDELISFDYIRENTDEAVVTENIDSYIYTKYYDMGNGYNEKHFRRIHLDVIDSFGVGCDVSVQYGEYGGAVLQVKRDYFNDIPYRWFRFIGIYGDREVDYGKRGGDARVINVIRNLDGKIDRVFGFSKELKSRFDLGNIEPINNVTITGWLCPELNERMVVLTTRTTPFFIPNEIDYAESDFDSWVSDTTDATTEFTGTKIAEDSASNMNINVDNCFWRNSGILGTAGLTFAGLEQGNNTRGGSVALTVTAGETWSGFANIASGMQTYTLPQIGVGEMIVGKNNRVL